MMEIPSRLTHMMSLNGQNVTMLAKMMNLGKGMDGLIKKVKEQNLRI